MKKVTPSEQQTIMGISQMVEWYLLKEREDAFIDFKREAGCVVSEQDTAIAFVRGSTGHVDFPEELIWDLHKTRPGYVFKIAHTHPPRMNHASPRDIQTLQTWAWAMHPFPARLSVITLWDRNQFVETTFMCTIEAKELWKQRGGDRKVFTLAESERIFKPSLLDRENIHDAWLLTLLKESYGKESN